jgi:Lon protease-like protein
MSEPSSPLADFAGTARLFPLPGLVFFPRVLQPLHIFEPRYRQMTADALAGDRLITMVLPRPGWEEDYDGRPALYPIACLGQIMVAKPLPDGRYNLLLHGLSRARLLEELPDEKLYRQARVQLLAEDPVVGQRQQHWRQRLIEKAPLWFPGPAEVTAQLVQMCAAESLSPGELCDKIAFALPLEVEFKQALLAELDDEVRLTRLFVHLEAKRPDFFPTLQLPETPPAKRRPPHDFSAN